MEAIHAVDEHPACESQPAVAFLRPACGYPVNSVRRTLSGHEEDQQSKHDQTVGDLGFFLLQQIEFPKMLLLSRESGTTE